VVGDDGLLPRRLLVIGRLVVAGLTALLLAPTAAWAQHDPCAGVESGADRVRGGFSEHEIRDELRRRELRRRLGLEDDLPDPLVLSCAAADLLRRLVLDSAGVLLSEESLKRALGDTPELDVALGSTVALVARERLEETDEGWRLSPKHDSLGPCPEEPPVETQLADCSGVLVAEDVVLTAGHCLTGWCRVDKDGEGDQDEARRKGCLIVVDSLEGVPERLLPTGAVVSYDVIINRYATPGRVDWALLRTAPIVGSAGLELEVADRDSLADAWQFGKPVYSTGHSFGLARSGGVGTFVSPRSADKDPNRDANKGEFNITAPAYGGASGGPVWLGESHELAGLVIRSNRRLVTVKRPGKATCVRINERPNVTIVGSISFRQQVSDFLELQAIGVRSALARWEIPELRAEGERLFSLRRYRRASRFFGAAADRPAASADLELEVDLRFRLATTVYLGWKAKDLPSLDPALDAMTWLLEPERVASLGDEVVGRAAYNAACICARMGTKCDGGLEQASQWLTQAFERFPSKYAIAWETEEDLKAVRDDPEHLARLRDQARESMAKVTTEEWRRAYHGGWIPAPDEPGTTDPDLADSEARRADSHSGLNPSLEISARLRALAADPSRAEQILLLVDAYHDLATASELPQQREALAEATREALGHMHRLGTDTPAVLYRRLRLDLAVADAEARPALLDQISALVASSPTLEARWELDRQRLEGDSEG